MNSIIQAYSNRELTNKQKIGIMLVLSLEVIDNAYWKVNEYFDIEDHLSDRIWFYGFASFMTLMTVMLFFFRN